MINKLTLLVMCLCVSTSAQAIIVNSASTSISPAIPDPLTFESMTCRELYTVASKQEPQSQHFRSVLLNEHTDQLVSVIGTIYQPFFYYYGFYIPYHYFEEQRVRKASSILDMVRQRMAYLRCFD